MRNSNIRREVAERKDDNNLADQPPSIRILRPADKLLRRRAEAVRRTVRLTDIIANYSDLDVSGALLIAQCPFHNDPARSFAVYPEANTYRCTACGAVGDVLQFVMDKESMTLGQALDALERFHTIHELYGTS